MKLSKKLVVTGLLFSSILESVNVREITAMAATESTVHEDAKKAVIWYSIDGIPSDGTDENLPKQLSLTAQGDKVSEDELKEAIKGKYEIDTTVADNLKYDSKTKTAKVELKALKKTVTLNFVDENNNSIVNKDLEKTIDVDMDTSEIIASHVHLPKDYKFINANETIKIPTDNSITIKIRKVELVNVSVNFTDELGRNLNLPDNIVINNIDLAEGITTKNIKNPNGYAVVEGQTLNIKAKNDEKAKLVYSTNVKVKKLVNTTII